jgi:polyhydroxybutyrate depolymerase
MKYIALILSITALTSLGYSQQTINGSIIHDGVQRNYILYIPAIYTGTSSVPLVLNFHGYGSNATEQMWYGDFRSISDTAGFLIVHPEGTLLNGTTYWNVGGWTIGSTVDDVGFTEALIDTLTLMYNIEETRIYSTGMSNGGFMSFLLAGQLSGRIAAIASVTGSMTPENFNSSNPQHPTPIMQIHGTSDDLIPYNGISYSKPIEDVLQYWAGFNNCNTSPEITALPNLDPNDGSTVEHFAYEGGDNGVSVEHFKITGGEHTWPGSAVPLPGTNNDIIASIEIWKFFSKYDINGLMGTTGMKPAGDVDVNLTVFPNPTDSYIYIEGNVVTPVGYELRSTDGKILMQGELSSSHDRIDVSLFPPNIYFLKVGLNTFKIIKN